MVSSLVKAGYGNYDECDNANYVDAVTFLYVTFRGTIEDKIQDHLNG